MSSVLDKLTKIRSKSAVSHATVSWSANQPVQLSRHVYANAALRERESAWWSRYAQVEDLYFWRLPENLQPPARLRYVERIASYLSGASTIVDYGCGGGWLSRMLSQHVDADVIGLDFSIPQIQLARETSSDFSRLQFKTIGGPSELPSASAYLFHGVLHHLPMSEIDELVSNLKARALPGAKLVVVEPTCFPGNEPDHKDQILLDAMSALVKEPLAVLKSRGLVECAAIGEVRSQSDERWWGTLPYGPSPMEKPFEGFELPRYLSQNFNLLSSELVQFLPASQAMAGELAMIAASAPELAQEIGPDLQKRVDSLEKVLLQYPTPPDAGWYMNLMTLRIN